MEGVKEALDALNIELTANEIQEIRGIVNSAGMYLFVDSGTVPAEILWFFRDQRRSILRSPGRRFRRLT